MSTPAPAALAYERQGSGPPLVLLHGVGHRRQAWDAVTGQLASQRDLIAVDLPGHGGSPPLDTGRPAPAVMVEAVLALLDRLGLDCPHFAGNSLGGLLALEAAAAGRAASVTALSPAGFFRGRADTLYARGVLQGMQAAGRWLTPAIPALSASAAGRGILFGALVTRPGQVTASQAAGDAEAFGRASDALDAVLDTVENFTGQIPASVPVTIAWGERDRLLPRRQALLARRQLPGARFVLLPGCGHVPMTDDPQLVASVLLRGSREAQPAGLPVAAVSPPGVPSAV